MNDGEKPGKHPDPNHDWNTNPKKYEFNEDDDATENKKNKNGDLD